MKGCDHRYIDVMERLSKEEKEWKRDGDKSPMRRDLPQMHNEVPSENFLEMDEWDEEHYRGEDNRNKMSLKSSVTDFIIYNIFLNIAAKAG